LGFIKKGQFKKGIEERPQRNIKISLEPSHSGVLKNPFHDYTKRLRVGRLIYRLSFDERLPILERKVNKNY